MSGWKEPRYVQLVATEARDFAVWPIGRRPPEGWRIVPFAGTVQACGRHVAELAGVGAERVGGVPEMVDAALVGLLRKAAAEQPDGPALSSGGLGLSYRRLWEAVDEVAERLSASGVGPGRRVAVLGSTTPDLLVTVLAVLVTGGTCALWAGAEPDDAPAVVAGAQAGMVLAPADIAAGQPWWPHVRDRWRGVTGAVWQMCGAPEPATADAPGSLVLLPPSARAGAGVVWRDRQLTRLAGACGLPWSDRLLPSAPLGTPVATVVAVRALLTGAELVLPGAGGEPEGDAPRIGGEPADGAGPARWRLRGERAGGPPAEVELLGFAETTMLCATVVPGSGELAPLPETRRYVLDAELAPVRPGEIGELYVAGPGLAAGYLDRPELTMARFVPDPRGPAEGGLMFRAGSLARRLPEHRFALVEGAGSPTNR